MAPTARNTNGNKKRAASHQPKRGNQANGNDELTSSIIVAQPLHRVSNGRVGKAGKSTRHRNATTHQERMEESGQDAPKPEFKLDFSPVLSVVSLGNSSNPSAESENTSLSIDPRYMPKPDDLNALEMARSVYGNDFVAPSGLGQRLASIQALRQPIQRNLDHGVNLNRTSNSEAVLAQIVSIALNETQECEHCSKGDGPYTECVVLPGSLSGACVNCWFNASGSRCTYHNKKVPKVQGERQLRWIWTPTGMQLQRFQPVLPVAGQPAALPMPQQGLIQQAMVEHQLGDLAGLIDQALPNADPIREILGRALQESLSMSKKDRLLAKIQHKVEQLGFVLAEYREYCQTLDGQAAGQQPVLEHQAISDSQALNGTALPSPAATHQPDFEIDPELSSELGPEPEQQVPNEDFGDLHEALEMFNNNNNNGAVAGDYSMYHHLAI